MADNAPRRGATDLGMPLMIVAMLTIGGFFYWLAGQVADERAIEIVEDTTGTTGPSAPTVSAGELEVDASPYVGERVRLAGLSVASLLGTQGFWLQMPRAPFLVSLSPELRADGVTVEAGTRATVIGTILAVNDSILTSWIESGSITENERIVAEFATHFLEAESVQTTGGPGGGTP